MRISKSIQVSVSVEGCRYVSGCGQGVSSAPLNLSETSFYPAFYFTLWLSKQLSLAWFLLDFI
jgi:hypothetical protein